MLPNVDGLAVVVFERAPETPGGVEIDARGRQRREHHLKLVKHAVFALLLRRRGGVHAKNRVTQLGHHVQLLEDAVHVARGARVFKAHVTTLRPVVVAGEHIPLVHVHAAAVVKVHENVRHLQHVFRVVRAKIREESKRGGPRRRRRAHRRQVLVQHLHLLAHREEVRSFRVELGRLASSGDGSSVPDDVAVGRDIRAERVGVVVARFRRADFVAVVEVGEFLGEFLLALRAPHRRVLAGVLAVGSIVAAVDDGRGHARELQHLRGRPEHRDSLREEAPEEENLHEPAAGGFGPAANLLQALDEAPYQYQPGLQHGLRLLRRRGRDAQSLHLLP